MKLRNPIIALGILAALSAYVYLVEIRGGKRKQEEKEASEHVLPLKADDVTGLQLVHGGERVRLEKVAGKWQIQEPHPAAPDTEAVDRIVRSLEDLRIVHDLGMQTDLASFHLKDPSLTLEIQATTKTPPPPLSLGDDAPTGGGAYARLGSSNKVLVVSGASSLQGATFFSLRDKSFLQFNPSRLSTLRILRGKEEIALSRSGGKWSLSGPIKAPADDSIVSDLLFALQRITVTEFVEESPAAPSLESVGLKPPQTRVVLAGEEWKGEKDLAFGKVEGGSYYALHPGTGALVRVPETIQAKLGSTVAVLRRKSVLPVPRFEMTRLKMVGIGPQPLELERSEDHGWKRVSPSPGTLASDPVDELFRNLDDLKADAFVDEPGKDLARYGLASPTVRLECWRKEQEKGQPEVLEIGRPDSNGRIPMRNPSWPSVLLVPKSEWEAASRQAGKVVEEKPESEKAASPTSPAKAPKPSGGQPPGN